MYNHPTCLHRQFFFHGWRVASLLLFLFIGFISIMGFGKGPGGVDCWYHMAVAKNILEKGRIPLYADWECYPVGRPHLYPPLMHICVALCSFLFNGNVYAGGRLFNVLMLPTSLLLIMKGLKEIYEDAWKEFLVLLILCLDPIFYIVHKELVPSALASSLAVLALGFFWKKKTVKAVTSMTLCLYTHLGIPYLFLLGLLIFSLIRREYLSFYVKSTIYSFILFLPWGLHVLFNYEWLRIGVRLIRGTWPVILSVCTVLGLIGALQTFQCKDNTGIISISCLLGFTPAFILYGLRFWAHSSVPWAMLALIPLHNLSKSSNKTKTMLTSMLLCGAILIQPVAMLSMKEFKAGFIPSGLRSELETPFKKDYSILGEDVKVLVALINSKFKEIKCVHVNKGWIGEMIYVFTGKKTDLPMYGEALNPKQLKPVLEAIKHEKPALFIYLKAEGKPPRNVNVIKEIGRFYLAVRW